MPVKSPGFMREVCVTNINYFEIAIAGTRGRG